MSKHIIDMLNRTLTTHNGHNFTLDRYNKLSKKINEHQTIYTLLLEHEVQQLKTATITIRNLIDQTQTLFLADTQANNTTLVNPQEYQQFLPEPEDYHYPIG